MVGGFLFISLGNHKQEGRQTVCPYPKLTEQGIKKLIKKKSNYLIGFEMLNLIQNYYHFDKKRKNTFLASLRVSYLNKGYSFLS